MKAIRRRLAVAGTIAALAGLAGVAYAAGTAPPPKAPLVASAHGGRGAAVSTRASGKHHKRRHRANPVRRSGASAPPVKTRASGRRRHGRGEREHERGDDAIRTGVDA